MAYLKPEKDLSASMMSGITLNKKFVVVDSFAWIEYFKATDTGQKAREFIDDLKNTLFTVDVCVAEIKFWALQKKLVFNEMFAVIRSNSTIIETNSNDWLEAAEIKFEHRKTLPNFGLVDALIIAKSNEIGAKILTGDKHFKNEKNAVMI